jgi:hypothetical protein
MGNYFLIVKFVTYPGKALPMDFKPMIAYRQRDRKRCAGPAMTAGPPPFGG